MTIEEMKKVLSELKEEEYKLQEDLYYCQGNIQAFEDMIEENEK